MVAQGEKVKSQQEIADFLNRKVDDIPFGLNANSAVRAHLQSTIFDLVLLDRHQFRRLGKVSQKEIEDELKPYRLKLFMTVEEVSDLAGKEIIPPKKKNEFSIVEGPDESKLKEWLIEAVAETQPGPLKFTVDTAILSHALPREFARVVAKSLKDGNPIKIELRLQGANFEYDPKSQRGSLTLNIC